MVVKLTRLTHKILIQLHLVAESCTICSSCSSWAVQKLYVHPHTWCYNPEDLDSKLQCHKNLKCLIRKCVQGMYVGVSHRSFNMDTAVSLRDL